MNFSDDEWCDICSESLPCGCDSYYDDEDEDADRELVLDCGLEGCLMPEYHLRSECHTIEMLLAFEEEILKEAENSDSQMTSTKDVN